MLAEDEAPFVFADQQRNLVYNFCRQFAEEAGYTIDEKDDKLADNYENVTGEAMVLSQEELNEM